MTVLFDKTVPIQAGAAESQVFAVPAQFQAPGQQITVFMDAAAFPTGQTRITIFISTDGGSTFRQGGPMVVERPSTVRPGSFESLGLSLGVDEVPTNAKYSTDAPSAFTARTILQTS